MLQSLVKLSVVSVCVLLLCGSCANIVPPMGGPRDSLPPRLVLAVPRDSAVNVSPKQISFTFDEYVSLDNWYANLIVSPTLKYPLNVTSRLRNVTVTIKDTLDANTTYLFDFGNAIRDVNENNVATNFRYAFSTGSQLDNHTYSGKVILANTGKPDSNLYVMLHRDLSDSAVYKSQPRYYTRMNARGEFRFHNLPEGRFAVYVIDAKSPMKTYSDSSFYFAFRSEPLAISASTPHDTLYAYQAFERKDDVGAAVGAGRQQVAAGVDKRLRYAAQLEGGMQDLLDSLTLVFQRKLTVFDSTKVVLYDTLYNRLTGYQVLLDSSRTKLSILMPWKQQMGYRLIMAKDAFADSLGNTLPKADTVHFTTKRESEYGSIRIRMPEIDLSRNPVLLLFRGEVLVESIPLTEKEVIRKLYRPGSYDVGILYDTNGNGKWDPGQFLPARRQPEIVVRYPKQVVVRANWDNDVTL